MAVGHTGGVQARARTSGGAPPGAVRRRSGSSLLGCPASAAAVANVTRLLTGTGRTARIHVLSFAAFVPSGVLIDLVFRSVLLLAGNGLLMIVCRSGLLAVFLAWLRRTSVISICGHGLPPLLEAAAIAAHLIRSVRGVFRKAMRIRFIGHRKRVLILGWAVTDPLLGAIAVIWINSSASRADCFFAMFVLTRSSARLAHVDE
jgi:hypothetical protein